MDRSSIAIISHNLLIHALLMCYTVIEVVCVLKDAKRVVGWFLGGLDGWFLLSFVLVFFSLLPLLIGLSWIVVVFLSFVLWLLRGRGVWECFFRGLGRGSGKPLSFELQFSADLLCIFRRLRAGPVYNVFTWPLLWIAPTGIQACCRADAFCWT